MPAESDNFAHACRELIILVVINGLPARDCNNRKRT